MSTNKIGFSGTPGMALSFVGVAYLTTTVLGSQVIAPESGTCEKMFIYKSDSSDLLCEMGVYSSIPGTLLSTTGSTVISGGIGWQEVQVPSFQVISGQYYHPVVVATTGNTAFYGYDTTAGNGCSRSYQSPLPTTWTDPQNRTYCAAVYMEYEGDTPGLTLDAEAGSYSITGSDISLLHNRVLTAESGSYSLIGSDINLNINRVLNAESGNYTVNGSEIDLSVNRVITAESGSYNIIGADIEMSISSELAILAEAGHYEITGSDIDLIVNRVLNAESGSYNITGGDIDLTVVADKILNAESGNYNITGSDIELKIDRVLNAESGSYSIIGSDVELIWSGQPIAKGLVNISMDLKVQDITMDLKAQTITMELTI